MTSLTVNSICHEEPDMTKKKEDLSAIIIDMERAALDRWCNGDPSGFLEICAPDVVYFDPIQPCRLDGLPALQAYYEGLRGTIRADRYEMIAPHVQVGSDMAVLTFNFVSSPGEEANRWNCTEVYRRQSDKKWRIVQTHWSRTGPLPGAEATRNEAVSSWIIGMERMALDRWCKNDPSGYLEICAPDVVYFDPIQPCRLDGLPALKAYYESLRDEIRVDRYELIAPHVQVGSDMALLTFHCVSYAGEESTRWNCTEAYRLESEGQWRIVQTHWSRI
jgi:ketosteroid isomerase-like protein